MLVDEPTNIPNEFLYCFSMFLDQEYIPGPAQRLYLAPTELGTEAIARPKTNHERGPLSAAC